jgi:hypothetical protein
LRRLAKIAAVLLLLLALLTGVGLYYMGRQDAEHDRFFQTGSSINSFLKEYAHDLRQAFATGDIDTLARLYADDYRAPDRGHWVLKRDADLGDVAVFRLEPADHDALDRSDLKRELAGYLDGLTAVDDVKCKIDLIEHAEHGQSAVLTVKFILDGKDRQGAVFQDRHFYRWHLVTDTTPDGPGWRIARDELVEGVRVAGNGHGFEAVNPRDLGIDFVHARDPKLDVSRPDSGLRFGVIEHAMGGVSVVDYDNDGRPDIFFADGKRCRLYHNDGPDASGRPHFSDVTSAAGLDGLDQANSGIWADLDNDGWKDLVVIRYCAPCKVFHNNGDGTFTDRTREMGLDLNAPCLSACFLDYDRDGFVDLYVAVYGDAFHDIPRLPFYAQNGGRNRLFRNVRGKAFVDVTDASGTGDTGWGMAVAAADYDNDGWPDIAVANDFGRKCLYHNNGDGTFTEVAKQAGVLDFSGGMGVAFADFEDTGWLGVYFSNINSNQRWFGEDQTVHQYLRNVVRTRWFREDFGEYRRLHDLLGDRWRELGKMIGKGNSLFHNNGDGTFRELTDSHTNRAGWGWGVAFLDMNNSTRLDIFAANGWITNKPDTDL